LNKILLARHVSAAKHFLGLLFRYISEMKDGKATNKMGHLACFMGGLYVLGIKGAPSQSVKDVYLENAIELAATCHAGYLKSPTQLGPEEMTFGSTVAELSSSSARSRCALADTTTLRALGAEQVGGLEFSNSLQIF
jgi:mannosyl-oligosaccharide alpha-1,2-mannosidase